MRQKRILLTLIPALLLVLQCGSVKDLNVENPDYILRDLRPRVSLALPLSASSIDIDMNVEIRNPNSFGLKLDRIDFNVLVNNQGIARGRSNDRITIPARGDGQVRLKTRVDYRDVKTIFRELADIIEGDRGNYEVRGRAYYKTPIGVIDFPFTVFKRRL